MSEFNLLTGVTTNLTGSPVNPQRLGREDGVLQVDINSGTATVTVYGRLNAGFNYQQVFQAVSSGLYRITILPDMYAATTNIAGATVNVGIQE
jgi:hypothetical protein